MKRVGAIRYIPLSHGNDQAQVEDVVKMMMLAQCQEHAEKEGLALDYESETTTRELCAWIDGEKGEVLVSMAMARMVDPEAQPTAVALRMVVAELSDPS